MSNDLVPTSNSLSILPSHQELRAIHQLAETLVQTGFVPADFRGQPASALACILYGAELGLGPMQSLQGINVIKGKPSMSAELMRAVVRRAGHRIEAIERTDKTCTLRGTRGDDGTSEEVTWTMADAQRAGLASGNVWKAYPKTMLANRATTELCRSLFADVIKGISYTPDEAESFGTPAGTVQDVIDADEQGFSDEDDTPVSDDIIRRIMAAGSDLQLTDRDIVKGAGIVVGRQIGTLYELTEEEGDAVVARMEAKVKSIKDAAVDKAWNTEEPTNVDADEDLTPEDAAA